MLKPVEPLPSLVDDIESLEAQTGQGEVCWLTACEGIVAVREMDDSHLVNTARMLFRTKRVEQRGAYFPDGSCFAVWSRMQWAEFLGNEAARRDLEVPL